MGATCHACIGGTNVRSEMQKLQAEAPHIVVGTPGRVFDMLNRRYLCEYQTWPRSVEGEGRAPTWIMEIMFFGGKTSNTVFLQSPEMDQDVCSG